MRSTSHTGRTGVVPFATALLGWKSRSQDGPLVPNCADKDSQTSIRLAAGMLDALGVTRGVASAVPADPGGPLEQHVRDDLASALPQLDARRGWEVARGRIVTDFAQYAHLAELDVLVRHNPHLRVTIGRDYLIKPDVTVGIVDETTLDRHPFLHAAIACKWTIRSDRVQNIRHECNQMIRHRRGRQPHLVTVTAEPLPTRLASIARGTGEVDAVYHIAFDALAAAVDEYGNDEQVTAWDECVGQKRLLNYADLARTIARW
jgi:hypothetical protein